MWMRHLMKMTNCTMLMKTYIRKISIFIKNKELEDEVEELEYDLDESRNSLFGEYIDDIFSDDY